MAIRPLLRQESDRVLGDLRGRRPAVVALMRVRGAHGGGSQPHPVPRFLAEELRGKFVLWLSVVLWLNVPHLIKEALGRLGFQDAFPALSRHALRRGMNLDRFTLFSWDLGERSRPRVKVYASHYAAEVKDIERAASVAAVYSADMGDSSPPSLVR